MPDPLTTSLGAKAIEQLAQEVRARWGEVSQEIRDDIQAQFDNSPYLIQLIVDFALDVVGFFTEAEKAYNDAYLLSLNRDLNNVADEFIYAPFEISKDLSDRASHRSEIDDYFDEATSDLYESKTDAVHVIHAIKQFLIYSALEYVCLKKTVEAKKSYAESVGSWPIYVRWIAILFWRSPRADILYREQERVARLISKDNGRNLRYLFFHIIGKITGNVAIHKQDEEYLSIQLDVVYGFSSTLDQKEKQNPNNSIRALMEVLLHLQTVQKYAKRNSQLHAEALAEKIKAIRSATERNREKFKAFMAEPNFNPQLESTWEDVIHAANLLHLYTCDLFRLRTWLPLKAMALACAGLSPKDEQRFIQDFDKWSWSQKGLNVDSNKMSKIKRKIDQIKQQKQRR